MTRGITEDTGAVITVAIGEAIGAGTIHGIILITAGMTRTGITTITEVRHMTMTRMYGTDRETLQVLTVCSPAVLRSGAE